MCPISFTGYWSCFYPSKQRFTSYSEKATTRLDKQERNSDVGNHIWRNFRSQQNRIRKQDHVIYPILHHSSIKHTYCEKLSPTLKGMSSIFKNYFDNPCWSRSSYWLTCTASSCIFLWTKRTWLLFRFLRCSRNLCLRSRLLLAPPPSY